MVTIVIRAHSFIKLSFLTFVNIVGGFQGYYIAHRTQILNDQIDDAEFLEFAINNFNEMMGYIA